MRLSIPSCRIIICYATYLFICSQLWNFLYFFMRVIARKTLREFWNNHSDSEDSLKTWFTEAENSQWESPSDIKNKYPNASIIPDNRVVFNIKGNNYRLVVKINYDYGQVFIRFVGTHAEYDKIDATTI